MSLPFSLPQDDLWNYLAKAAKPIFLYGMGDGADKVLSVLSSRGIAVPMFSRLHLFAVSKRVEGFAPLWSGLSDQLFYNVSINE